MKRLKTTFLLIVICSFLYNCTDNNGEENKQNAIIYFNQGVQLAEDGDYEEAIKFFSSSLNLNPTDSLALINRAVAKHNMGNFKEAISFSECVPFWSIIRSLEHRIVILTRLSLLSHENKMIAKQTSL